MNISSLYLRTYKLYVVYIKINYGGVIMPRGDRRGPEGAGPMTGRGFGYCSGSGRPGYLEESGYGRGRSGGRGLRRGIGFGGGRGYGYFSQTAVTSVSEKTLIENEMNTLKDQLESLNKRLSEIEKKD